MGASTATGGGSYGGGERDRKEQQNVVNKVIVKTAAAKEKQKQIAAGNKMYGGKVAEAIDMSLKNVEGAVMKDSSGNIIKTASGRPILTSYGAGLKYGAGGPGTAMGTGDPSGALTSTAISSEMLKSQNKAKGLILAGLSVAAPTIVGTPMRLSAGKAAADFAQPEEAYADYTKMFQAKQTGKKFTSDRTILGLLGLKDKKTTKTKLGG